MFYGRSLSKAVSFCDVGREALYYTEKKNQNDFVVLGVKALL